MQRKLKNLLEVTWLRRTLQILVFLFLWLYLSNFSSHKNNNEEFHYQSVIFADRAGYFVYLPATFIYDFDATKFPEGIDKKTGDGFKLDLKNNKIRTKYTCGIAILASPFFLTNHFYQKLNGNPSTGFSKSYFKSINYASVFYLLIGFIFLFAYLKNFYSKTLVIVSLGILFFTTHIFYYSLIETFMTHVYSFSLFSILLWTLNKYSQNDKIQYFILLSIIAGLIILIRPINILFFVPILFLNVNSWESIKIKFSKLFKPLNIGIFIFIVVLILLPQLFYYKYISGSYFFNSYGNESFSNLFSPKFLEVLFSTQNGLLLYTPMFLFVIMGCLILISRKKLDGYITLFVMFLMVYISASWWAWAWGCSLSCRPMVDVLPILSIPITAFFEWLIKTKSWLVTLPVIVIIALFGFWNVKFSSRYSHCFMGSEWDWREFNTMLKTEDIFPFNTKTYTSIFLKEEFISVKIKTSNGDYLNVEDNGVLTLVKGNKRLQSEEFNLLKTNKDEIALKAFNGKYLTSEKNGLCVANRTEIGNWERFHQVKLNNGYFVLVNSFGKYLGYDSNQVIGKLPTEDKAINLKFEYLQKD